MSFIRLKLLQVSMLQKKILARAGPTLFHTEDQKRAAIDTDDGATAGKRGEGKSEADQDEYASCPGGSRDLQVQQTILWTVKMN